VLNAVLDACPASAGIVACDDSPGFWAITESAACPSTVAAINAAVDEFRGPAGEDAALECAFGGMFYAASGCADIAASLNAMAEAFEAGGFQACEVTTPTTSPSPTRPRLPPR
jgi:hypothetical protein